MKTHQTARRTPIPALLLVCVLATGFSASAAPAAASPEQVAELYIGMFVNRDMDQAAELVEYLKPAYGGNPAYDLQEYRSEVAAMAEQHQQRASAMAADLPTEQRAGAEKALLDYALAIDYAISHAKCKAIDHTLEPNEVTREMGGEEYKDDVIAEVSYSCEVPAVDDAIVAQLHAAGSANDAAKLGRAAADFRKAMQSSGLWTTVAGTGTLYRHGPAGVWTNSNPGGWLDPILQGLPSIQADTGSDW